MPTISVFESQNDLNIFTDQGWTYRYGLLTAIRANRPNVTYEEMRDHLRDIAECELSTGRSGLFDRDMRDIYRNQYGELGESLTEALASEPLSIDQHRYINEALLGSYLAG